MKPLEFKTPLVLRLKGSAGQEELSGHARCYVKRHLMNGRKRTSDAVVPGKKISRIKVSCFVILRGCSSDASSKLSLKSKVKSIESMPLAKSPCK